MAANILSISGQTIFNISDPYLLSSYPDPAKNHNPDPEDPLNPDPSCFLTLPGINIKLFHNCKIFLLKEVH